MSRELQGIEIMMAESFSVKKLAKKFLKPIFLDMASNLKLPVNLKRKGVL